LTDSIDAHPFTTLQLWLHAKLQPLGDLVLVKSIRKELEVLMTLSCMITSNVEGTKQSSSCKLFKMVFSCGVHNAPICCVLSQFQGSSRQQLQGSGGDSSTSGCISGSSSNSSGQWATSSEQQAVGQQQAAGSGWQEAADSNKVRARVKSKLKTKVRPMATTMTTRW